MEHKVEGTKDLPFDKGAGHLTGYTYQGRKIDQYVRASVAKAPAGPVTTVAPDAHDTPENIIYKSNYIREEEGLKQFTSMIRVESPGHDDEPIYTWIGLF